MGSSRANFGVMGLCALMVGMMMMMIMAGGVAGQGPAPAPATADCLTVLLNLSDCLPYVTGGASSPPAATCCSNLSSVALTSAPCLCQLYNTSFTGSLGINISIADALRLPSACNVTTPDPSSCSLIGIPIPGPTASPPAATSPAGPGVAPSSVSTPSASGPTATPPAGTGMAPNTTAAPPLSPNGAPSAMARNLAVATSLVFALIFVFH